MTPLRLGGQWIGFLNCFHMVTNTLNVELVHSREGATGSDCARPTPGSIAGRPARSTSSWSTCRARRPPWVTRCSSSTAARSTTTTGGSPGPTESQRAPERSAHVPEVHDENAIGYHLGLAKLRRDGYVSLDAGREREGLLVTQPFLSPGDRLVINAACGASGSIRVEVTDEAERALPGRSLENCDVFTGDATEHVVTWNGDPTFPRCRADRTLGGCGTGACAC